MDFNLIGNVKVAFEIEGVTIGEGSMLQTPMLTGHYDEAVWEIEGHPAYEFWSERHIKCVEEANKNGQVNSKRIFSMTGRPSTFFLSHKSPPVSDGLEICPGRHYAKHGILATVALLVSDYDIQSVEWRKLDGSSFRGRHAMTSGTMELEFSRRTGTRGFRFGVLRSTDNESQLALQV
ncbi:putative Cytochrome P450 [Seiridium cardinale]